MAIKKTAVAPSGPDGNIANLAALKKEFVKGEMVPRKLVMLRERLIDLHHKNSLTGAEQDVMELILKRDRLKLHPTDKVYDRNVQIINWIERNKCELECRCKTADASNVLRLTKDSVYRYYRNDDTERYHVYVEYITPGIEQKSKDLVLMEERGHFPDADKYPQDRTDIRLLDVDEKAFKSLFDFEEDLLNEEKEDKENYTF